MCVTIFELWKSGAGAPRPHEDTEKTQRTSRNKLGTLRDTARSPQQSKTNIMDRVSHRSADIGKRFMMGKRPKLGNGAPRHRGCGGHFVNEAPAPGPNVLSRPHADSPRLARTHARTQARTKRIRFPGWTHSPNVRSISRASDNASATTYSSTSPVATCLTQQSTLVVALVLLRLLILLLAPLLALLGGSAKLPCTWPNCQRLIDHLC